MWASYCNLFVFNLLKPTGSRCTNMLNIKYVYILPTLYLCFFAITFDQRETFSLYNLH